MKKRGLLIAGVCLVGGLTIWNVMRSRTPAVAAAAGPEALPTVAVAKATRGDLSHDVVLTAEFEPFQDVDVMAKVAGFVKQINVDIGDRVRQGQLLAVLEVPEMGDDLTKAEAAIQRNTAETARARDELRRAESAHEMSHLSFQRLSAVIKQRPGLVAQQEIDDARSRDLVSEAQVAAAQSALAAAQEQVKVAEAEQARIKTLFNYTKVTAPFAGVITKRYADTGSMIQAGTASQTQAMPLVRLSENSLLRLVLPVPESVVSRIRVGEPLEVRVPSLNRTFQGRVARFADKVQSDTRTMSTEVDVPNAQLILIPGMFAEVSLTLERENSALSVPVSAVAAAEGGHFVYLVNGSGRIEQRPVVTGLQTSTRFEVRTGLRPGDLVVIGNRSELRPGEAVKTKLVELAAVRGEE